MSTTSARIETVPASRYIKLSTVLDMWEADMLLGILKRAVFMSPQGKKMQTEIVAALELVLTDAAQ